MNFNVKKALLAGTALVAVGAFATPAHATVVAQTLTGAAEWASAGTRTQADITTAAAGDTVNLATFTLTVQNDGTNSDTAATLQAFNLGAVTGTTGSLLVSTSTTSAYANDLTATIDSVAISGAGSVTVTNQDDDNAAVAATVTNTLSTGGNLAVTNNETSVAKTVALSVGGNATVTGTTAVTAGGFAGANTTLTLGGASNTLTGATTVTAATAATTANVVLTGASTNFAGGLNLVTAGRSKLNVSSTSAQTVAGTITGAGDIVVANSSTAGATFTGAVTTGTITVEKTAGNSSATFKNAVTATSITLGTDAHAGDVNTVTFDGTTAGFTVAGTLNGTATETDNVVVTGGHTIVQSGIWGGTNAPDALTVSGSGTLLDSNAAITATAVTIGSGATLDSAALITASSGIANSGTLLLSGTTGVAANITGTGTLSLTDNNTVTGNITQGAVSVAAAKTLTATGNVTAPVTLGGAGATLALSAAAHTVTGNVTTSGATGTGAITVADSATTQAFVGDLGTSSLHLASLAVAGAAANLVTTTGNVYVDAITANAADTIQFLGNSAQTVSGTVTGGILSVGNGTTTSDVSFNGVTSGLASSTLAAGSIARYNANSTVTGAYTNGGNTYVASGKTLSAGSFAGAGTYNIEVNDAGTLGTLEAVDVGHLGSGAAIDLAAETVNFNVTGNVATGTLAGAFAGGAAAVAASAVTDNSFQYAFALTPNGNNFDLVVTKSTIAALGLTTENSAVGTVLDTLGSSTNTQLAAIVDNVAKASSKAAANEVVESTLPSVDAGAVNAGFDASVQSLGVTETRLASLRNGTEQTGMVAGDIADGVKAWAQAFGKSGNQDDRKGVNGYDSHTYGFALGADSTNVAPDATVGLALSYGNTDVKSQNANSTKSNVDSYQVSLYGNYDVAPRTYVSGTLAYARNSIDQTRHNVGGVAGLTADASYDSNQYIVYTEAGHKFDIAQNTVLTPKVLAHYQHITIGDYTETGAGGANLNVSNDSLNVFEVGVGTELAWNLKMEDGGKVRPALNVGYRHDLIGDNVQSSSNFTGGGAAFTTQGVDPAKGTFNVGASVGFALDNNWEVTTSYDYEVKQDYDAHSGFIRAGYKF